MKVRQPYSVDSFSQWVAATVFRERMVFEQAIRDIMRGRDQLMHGLAMHRTASRSSPPRRTSCCSGSSTRAALWRDLLHNHSVLVRDFSRTPGLEDCLRVTVGTAEENRRFLEAVDEMLAVARSGRALRRAGRGERHE